MHQRYTICLHFSFETVKKSEMIFFVIILMWRFTELLLCLCLIGIKVLWIHWIRIQWGGLFLSLSFEPPYISIVCGFHTYNQIHYLYRRIASHTILAHIIATRLLLFCVLLYRSRVWQASGRICFITTGFWWFSRTLTAHLVEQFFSAWENLWRYFILHKAQYLLYDCIINGK